MTNDSALRVTLGTIQTQADAIIRAAVRAGAAGGTGSYQIGQLAALIKHAYELGKIVGPETQAECVNCGDVITLRGPVWTDDDGGYVCIDADEDNNPSRLHLPAEIASIVAAANA